MLAMQQLSSVHNVRQRKYSCTSTPLLTAVHALLYLHRRIIVTLQQLSEALNVPSAHAHFPQLLILNVHLKHLKRQRQKERRQVELYKQDQKFKTMYCTVHCGAWPTMGKANIRDTFRLSVTSPRLGSGFVGFAYGVRGMAHHEAAQSNYCRAKQPTLYTAAPTSCIWA